MFNLQKTLCLFNILFFSSAVFAMPEAIIQNHADVPITKKDPEKKNLASKIPPFIKKRVIVALKNFFMRGIDGFLVARALEMINKKSLMPQLTKLDFLFAQANAIVGLWFGIIFNEDWNYGSLSSGLGFLLPCFRIRFFNPKGPENMPNEFIALLTFSFFLTTVLRLTITDISKKIFKIFKFAKTEKPSVSEKQPESCI